MYQNKLKHKNKASKFLLFFFFKGDGCLKTYEPFWKGEVNKESNKHRTLKRCIYPPYYNYH